MTLVKRPAILAIAIAALMALPAFAQQDRPGGNVPPDELFAPVGTVLTVQIRDRISSDRNASGDGFMAVLQQPLVIDGWVVARPGQTVLGQVASANSAGRVKGTSDLSVELTELVLVDGQQVPIRTQLLQSYGRETRSEDAVTIAGATGIGALIGAAAGNGKGAAIGAGIGAAAATIGVLSTRGKPTEIYPQSTVTFRLDAPLVVSTVRTQRAFAAVTPEDYNNAPTVATPPRTAEGRNYPDDYDRYPRYPRYPGPRVGVIPTVILFPPPIIINNRGRHRY